MNKFILYSALLVFSTWELNAQKEASHWFFGTGAGVDFTHVPPAADSSGVPWNYNHGSASISDAEGNLILYTNGFDIYNKQHQVIANGSDIWGNNYLYQTAVIIPKPGSNDIYYVFTANSNTSHTTGYGFRYTKVDMSLAAGQGSVTAKNMYLSQGRVTRVTAVKHCNGSDYWVVTTDPRDATIKAFRVSTSGVSINPVTTPLLVQAGNGIGDIRISPNGKKIAFDLSSWSINRSVFILGDFDNSTGQVLNQVELYSRHLNDWHSGTEFSPYGSKLYHTTVYANQVMQWDLCAGSASAIAASRDSFPTGGTVARLQLGPDGRIYVARVNQRYLGMIGNPDSPAAQVNYTDSAQTLGKGTCNYGVTNFICSYFKEVPAFTYTDNSQQTCNTAIFKAPPLNLSSCIALNGPYTGVMWNFGDPATGSANTSTLSNVTHTFSSGGKFRVKLIYSSSCYADTVTKDIIVGADVSVTTSVTCQGIGSATVLANGGPFTFTWLPSGSTGSIVNGLAPGSHTLQYYYNSQTCLSAKVVSISIPGPSITITAPATICPGSLALLSATGASQYTWEPGGIAAAQAQATLSATTVFTITGTTSIHPCPSVKQVTVSVALCTDIEVNNSISRPEIYPVPTDRYLTLKNSPGGELFIADVLGKVVHRQEIFSKNMVIDLYDLPAGIYFIKFSRSRLEYKIAKTE